MLTMPRPTGPDTARRRLTLALASLAAGTAGLSGCTAGRRVARPIAGSVVGGVPAFEAEGGGLSPQWRPYVLRRDRGVTRYDVDERDGQVAVRAEAASSSSGLLAPVRTDLAVTPWLHWRWLADRLATGASVDDDLRDDAVARVMVAFGGDESRLSLRDRLFFDLVELMTGVRLPPSMLMYVWDSTLPVGTVVNYPRTARIRYLVVDSGADGLGTWRAHARQVPEDHERVFGEPPPGPVQAVGLLTDTDDLRQTLQAWYGALRFSAGPDDPDPA